MMGHGMADHLSQAIRISAELTQLSSGSGIMSFAGEIDLDSVDVLHDEFQRAAECGYHQLVIDLTGVTFMDSLGLHALVNGKRLFHQNGSAVVLVPSRQVRRLLDLVSPEPLFEASAETVKEALALLGL
jgi:anti-anti-sigma factor